MIVDDLERLVAIDQIRDLMARYARLKAHRKGGHFVPWENPDAVIDDIRATFRGLR